jgi:hypothetical protein
MATNKGSAKSSASFKGVPGKLAPKGATSGRPNPAAGSKTVAPKPKTISIAEFNRQIKEAEAKAKKWKP